MMGGSVLLLAVKAGGQQPPTYPQHVLRQLDFESVSASPVGKLIPTDGTRLRTSGATYGQATIEFREIAA